MSRRSLAVPILLIVTACTNPISGPTTPTTTVVTTTVTTATITTPATTTATAASTTSTTTTLPAPEAIGTVSGLTMFRGNATRTFYGTGPIPRSAPQALWSYPSEAMCGTSVDPQGSRVWCGTGWTGQPVVWDRHDGITEVIFGAYDKSVHFVDAHTGRRTRPPFPTGDIIKGSVTLDPDGYPLLYTGSRDNYLHVIALDRPVPTEIWSLHSSVVNGLWNNDWDSNPVVIDDILYIGGENSWFFAVELHRSYNDEGQIVVAPQIVFSMPGYTDELIAQVGTNVSIESSVAVYGSIAYFTNSGGRVVGIDISDVRSGIAPVVFDFWAGDDIDATPVIDPDGMLYIAIEQERFNTRSSEVGQLIKLDPSVPDNPLVWGIDVPGLNGGDGGIWATPALGEGYLYVPTHSGRLLAVDTTTGDVTWEDDLGPHTWSSAVIVDSTLIVATCESPEIRAYDLSDPARPEPLWVVEDPSAGCIESTPAVWDGRLYVGSRDGFFRAYGNP